MASNRKSLASDIRECPVCLDDMTKKNPKLLSCKHSYCTPCLSGLAVANQRSGLKIQCPKCRHDTVVRSGKLSDLPDNFLLGELKAAIDETIRYPYCFYCHKLDTETKANSRCTNCRRYLCKDCLHKHKENPQFAKHEITPLLEEETEGSEVCSKHKEAALYVCRACTPVRLLCDVCMTLDDPCHNPEKFIDYTAALSEMQSELRSELSKERNFDENLSRVDFKRQMMIGKVQLNASTFIKSIESTRDEIISQIEKSFDTTSLKSAVNAVKESELRVKELVEKDEQKVTELSEGATQFTSTLKKLSEEEERALGIDYNMPPDLEEEKTITGTGTTHMKLKLFDIVTIRDNSEDLTNDEVTMIRRHGFFIPRYIQVLDSCHSIDRFLDSRPNKPVPRVRMRRSRPSKIDRDAGRSTKVSEKKVPTSVDPKTLKTEFYIGSSVEVTLRQAPHFGIIRWFGFYSDNDKPIVGIEMEEERDYLTDGTYMRTKLFDCPPKKACFTFLSKCKPDRRSNECIDE